MFGATLLFGRTTKSVGKSMNSLWTWKFVCSVWTRTMMRRFEDWYHFISSSVVRGRKCYSTLDTVSGFGQKSRGLLGGRNFQIGCRRRTNNPVLVAAKSEALFLADSYSTRLTETKSRLFATDVKRSHSINEPREITFIERTNAASEQIRAQIGAKTVKCPVAK